MILTRNLVLETMVRHETLTLVGLQEQEVMGFDPNKEQLHILLSELVETECLTLLNGVTPETYTITNKGIGEGKKLADVEVLKIAHSFGHVIR